jgi:hypothetical protein
MRAIVLHLKDIFHKLRGGVAALADALDREYGL